MNDDYAAYREGLYRIGLREQQINYLRATLKDIAARDRGIKTSANSDAMGLAWHRLHEAYYWLNRLKQTVRRIKLRIDAQAQRQKAASLYSCERKPLRAPASPKVPQPATHVA